MNLDVLDRAEPDLVLDLGQPCTWPLASTSPFAGPVLLEEAVQALNRRRRLQQRSKSKAPILLFQQAPLLLAP